MKENNFEHLRNKVCVITGGAGVIGIAICEAMLQAGIKTAIIDIRKEAAEDVAKKLQIQYRTTCIGVQADVLNRASLSLAKEAVNKTLGDIDFLINGAGGNHPAATTSQEQITDPDLLEGSFFTTDEMAFDKVFALNFTGTLLPTMIFAEDMVKKGKGSILMISSMNSFRPLTKIPAYSAAKASVNNFTQWLAVHFAKTGVRVNAIAPGFFLTNQNRFLLVDEITGEATPRGHKIMASTPIGNYGKPEDLQGACLFLLSEMSSFITGIILPVDGGYSAFGGV